MGKHDKLGYRLGLILTRLNNGESLAVRELSEEFNVCEKTMEGANKQVISSQADSLIKISRIWADF
ncbi:hypothetical protein M8R91_23210, partial [Enterobacter roggenkampii]|nr:hypothetical protein [Enterobacter roggenkampii]